VTERPARICTPPISTPTQKIQEKLPRSATDAILRRYLMYPRFGLSYIKTAGIRGVSILPRPVLLWHCGSDRSMSTLSAARPIVRYV